MGFGSCEVWAFDCEWAPDVSAGRRLYGLDSGVDDAEVLRVMWEMGGATPEDPRPFLKTILCRICSIAAVVRYKSPPGNPQIAIAAIGAPDDPSGGAPDEKLILKRFLEDGYSVRRPVLVGYNSRNADVHILLQRAFVNGLQLPSFFRESTAKPWNQNGIDLMDFLGGHGKGYSASLDEVANLCGIPGKLDTTGDDVARLYYGGRARAVVEYNMFDALTTYLVWLRAELVSGRFTAQQYADEQCRLHMLIEHEAKLPHGAYLQAYLDAWPL
jgi:predicted PolB exonuclease-like 3'-5' exonuclease